MRKPRKSIHDCVICGGKQRRNSDRYIVCENRCRFTVPEEWAEKEHVRRNQYYADRYKSKIDEISEKSKIYREKNSEEIKARKKAEYHRRPPEMNNWTSMKSRCYIKSDASYARYGGRGITVCDRWRYSFANFLEDMGPKPGRKYSIEREDNSKGYEPGNCKWATPKEQAANRVNSPKNRLNLSDDLLLMNEDGSSITAKEFAAKTGMSLVVVKYRSTISNDTDWILSSRGDRRPYLYKGHKYTMIELAMQHSGPLTKRNYIKLHQRIDRYGWDVDRAMRTPY